MAQIGGDTEIMLNEIAILRVIIAEKVNACDNAQQFLAISESLSSLIMECATLVERQVC